MKFDPGKEFDDFMADLRLGNYDDGGEFSGYEMERAYDLGVEHGKKLVVDELVGSDRTIKIVGGDYRTLQG